MTQQQFLLNALLLFGIFAYTFTVRANSANLEDPYTSSIVISNPQDTIPLNDRYGDFINNQGTNPFDLNDPAIIDQEVEYDPVSNQYIITEKIGDDFYRAPTYMSFREYLDYRAKQQERDYFNRLSGVSGGDRSASGKVDPIADVVEKKDLIDRLFGGTEVDIKPQGNIDLTFGVDYSYTDNPNWTEQQKRQGGFDFDMAIQMNVTGKIGDKLNLSTNYNTQATFDFDNQMKLDYDTDAFSEDEIIKKIEAGNVSMPLRGSLIQGSQSLFGLKTELQFGHLRITALASQQKSEQKDIVIQNGSQFQEFEVYADDYDENRNFFLAHYFRDNFEESLENLPQIKSLATIERIDVWLTNDRNDVNGGRDIVAIADLGEHEARTSQNNVIPVRNPPRNLDVTGETGLPSNDANNLYDNLIDNPLVRKIDRSIATLQNAPFGLTQSRDFEKVNARLLREGQEYTVHPQLGYISLNVNVRPDQVVGVAYQYSYNGKTYKVGELSNNVPSTSAGGNTVDPNDPTAAPTLDTLNEQNVLFVKMLKSTTPRVDLPTWDLMMKNFYSIGAYQVNQDDFLLDVYYEDPGEGQKRFLPRTNLAGRPLLRVFNLDQLNVQGDPQPDGVFDFVEGVTITPRNGRIMFPVLEPFGSSLADQITPDVDETNLVYQQLYDSTLTVAREYPHLNRFTIKGSYRSSVSSEISLGAFNIPRGSVRVTVGGQVLREGTDYEIDYNIGRVKVLRDDLLNSGAPIRVSFEDNTLFGFQTKTMVGLRADYELGDNFNIGGTYLHLFERPYTQKVNIGDDPINNRIYGLDLNFSKEAPWLTKAVDAIPFLNTKAASNITFSAEAAALKPGHSKAINEQAEDSNDKGGIVYLDDFEGSASTFDLRTPINEWVLASVPQNDENNRNPLFPESREINNLISGVNRAQLSWFRADRSLVNLNDPDDPNAINPYTAPVPQVEVFPNLQQTPDLDDNIPVLDLHYRPDERGPYNYDVPGGTVYSAGLNSNGGLNGPETRWAGIMRDLNTNDFEAANIEAVEFWMMSPFLGSPNDPDKEGEIYLNLGNVSEDVLRDSRKFFENGLPTPSNPNRRVDTTAWSVIPIGPQVNYAFDNNAAARTKQDVGFDGMDDAAERRYFANYLAAIQDPSNNLNQFAKDTILQDPSNDNFVFYRNGNVYSDTASILERYSRFNGPEGNSPISTGSSLTREQGQQNPDYEDLNQDNTLSETESYHQYRIPIRANGQEIDMESNPYIIDRQVSERTFNANGEVVNRYWYRFKIPINDINKTSVGGIQGFRSIRFIRMYMNGFKAPVTLRFARLGLIRNQWRKYTQLPLSNPDAAVIADGTPTTFDVTAVNIEENANRDPFNYVLPEGIQREQNLGVFNALQNEQSLSIRTCNLQNGDAKAIYKLLNLDMRLYERLKMFVHAEADDIEQLSPIEDGDLKLFIRLGSDFVSNYYEYEIPLKMSDPNAVNTGPTDLEYTREVWRTENELDISLQDLIELKKDRNAENAAVNEIYPDPDLMPEPHNNPVARIIGNPNLGFVKSVMIGIRNPYTPDGEEYCSEVWINELRVNGLDERGGAAAIARLDMQLADFGNVTVAGNISSIGFGSLDQKLNERNREEIKGFDVATNLELGKFLPEKTGVRVPFYAQYSEQISTPEYDPYDLDIKLKEKTTDTETRIIDGEEVEVTLNQAEVKKRAQTATTIKSYSFTNVRKERTGDGKPMPWDVSNFSFTYAHNQTNERTPLIEQESVDDYRGAVDYSYSSPLKPIQPFKKVKNKNLKFIKELNFNPVPNSFSFSTVMDRQFAETKYRFTDLAPQFSTFYNKRFSWDRNYNLNWDLMKALKLTYNANMNSVIDEPFEYDPDTDLRIDREVRNDSIWTNIKDFGRPKNFQQQLNVNYTLPFKNFPFLDWITAKIQYSGDYSWNAASLNTQHLGNIIQNNQNRSLSGDLNFEKIYNYSKYLKKINAKPRAGNKRKASTNRGKKKPNKKGDDNDKKGKKEKKEREPTKIERSLIRPLLLVRKARFNYGETFSTVVPGFRPETKFLGMNESWDAPGWDFVAGLQPNIRGLAEEDYYTERDWLYNLSQNNYVVDTIFLNQQVQQNYTQKIDAKLTIEPFTDFRIDIEANRNFSENHTQYFKDTTSLVDRRDERFDNGFYTPNFSHAVPRDLGSLTMTYAALNTFFQGGDTSRVKELFNEFEQNRRILSQRLGSGQHDDEAQAAKGYTNGYGEVNQDILIPAFLAAYEGKDVNSIKISPNYVRDVLFKALPKINWKLSYNGLAKLPKFKEIFQSFSLSHGYRSTLTVNSFATSLDYLSEAAAGRDGLNDLTLDYYSRIELAELAISEQFSPLLGIDVKLKNDMSFNVDYKKSRTLAMSFVTSILAETQSEEFVVGFGYLLKDIDFPFLTGSKKKKKGKKPKADEEEKKKPTPNRGRGGRGGGSGEPRDLTINFDFSFRKNATIQHYLDLDIQEPTRGYTEISISPAAEYQLNKQLSLRFFFDYVRNIPRISSSFPRTNSQGGVTVRFSLN